jgi:predicted transcriptional regulator
MNNQQNNVKVLTEKEAQIMNTINDGGSATFAQVIAVVSEKQLKRGNPLANAEVTKLVNYNFLLNAVYQNAVNNARVREGNEADFEAKQNWHEKVYDTNNGSIVRNRNKVEDRYLSGIVNNAKTLTYFVDGIEATAEQIETIKQFKPKVAKAVNQGLDNDIIFRTIKIEGIKEVRSHKQVLTY